MDDQILSLEHISLSYHTMKGETPALCDLTFSVKPGEFVALVGPSGCGKSTILNLISGLLKPEAGTLLSRGRPITEADLHIGYMLQRDHLFEWRTIYSNVLLGLEISRTLTPERKERGVYAPPERRAVRAVWHRGFGNHAGQPRLLRRDLEGVRGFRMLFFENRRAAVSSDAIQAELVRHRIPV